MAARLADSEAEVPAALRIASIPEGNLQGCAMKFTSGAAAGHTLYISAAME
ncbi:MAG: hypothetical protein RBG13Loki_3230, partial [Promethearchaeota archaeon CR_4]